MPCSCLSLVSGGIEVAPVSPFVTPIFRHGYCPMVYWSIGLLPCFTHSLALIIFHYPSSLRSSIVMVCINPKIPQPMVGTDMPDRSIFVALFLQITWKLVFIES